MDFWTILLGAICVVSLGYIFWLVGSSEIEIAKEEAKCAIENAKEVDPLLPCPICGGETKMNFVTRRWWEIFCTKCGLQGPNAYPFQENPRQKMVSAWNTRVESAPVRKKCNRCGGTGLLRVDEPECNGGRCHEPCDRCGGKGYS